MSRIVIVGMLALATSLSPGKAAAQAPGPTPNRVVPPASPSPERDPGLRIGTYRFRSSTVPSSPPASRPPTTPAPSDPSLRQAQAAPMSFGTPPLATPALGLPDVGTAPGSEMVLGGQSISLQTALYGALVNNPALVSIRNNATAPTPESVEVARRFPTTMNPTLWIDYRPINVIPQDPFRANGSNGSNGAAGSNRKQPYYHWGQQYIYISLRQPLELSHQTTHRYHMAQAAYDQYHWNVVQAEFQTMVQTYNLFQTAAYWREKYRLAAQLAEFNQQLQASIARQVEANQVPAADAVVAEIEAEATQQAVLAARQDYLTALNALQIQMDVPEASGLVEPLGEFALPDSVPPIDESRMIQTALQFRPSVHSAMAQVRGAEAALRLARADRMPNPVVGPEYEQDEGGINYVGLVYITPIPILNGGMPLVRQREAEARRARQSLHQAERQVVAEVRSAVAKWNGATELVRQSAGLTTRLSHHVESLDKLFQAGQTTLANLMQARQRLIQLENARLDATWQATQAQASLLLALGSPDLLQALVTRAETDAHPGPTQPPPAPPETAPAPFQPPSAPNR